MALEASGEQKSTVLGVARNLRPERNECASRTKNGEALTIELELLPYPDMTVAFVGMVPGWN